MPITLSALDPKQVASATNFEVLLGEPATRLLILSGIAVPEFWTNHDEETNQQEILVRLGVHVAQLDPGAVTNLGLASIENDETNFLFAVDAGTLEHEQPSGELVLRVQAAILGEETYLHRFSYQIVAHVRRERAQISGVIAVPNDIRDVLDLPPADLNAAFEITANRVERGGVPGGFAFDKLIPVQVGATHALRRSTSSLQFVEYSIDNCPFATPLIVDVKLTGTGWSGSLGVGQVAGGRPITLTGLAPDASGVDFSVGRFQPVR
ncbi:MAG TPA: hypothetical protein VMW48_09105 [Vicinamibacterales bacterium]|nr:hypothetical protein [Vicinamibacterales bacterium]